MATTIQLRNSGVYLAHLVLRQFPDGQDERKVSWWIQLLCKTTHERVKQTWDSSGFKSSQGAKYFSSTHHLAKQRRKSNVHTSADVELQLCCDSNHCLGNMKTWSIFFFHGGNGKQKNDHVIQMTLRMRRINLVQLFNSGKHYKMS